ncbi:hypothetical protein [Schaalia vaccimaxillae]|uniref:hypothetical protein n=1 Tax=Schaalia vaccimaxillae TaxID=183916 RepID=UPI000416BECC|nr:hypothetical protein [Schaalia vaccimaxillae]
MSNTTPMSFGETMTSAMAVGRKILTAVLAIFVIALLVAWPAAAATLREPTADDTIKEVVPGQTSSRWTVYSSSPTAIYAFAVLDGGSPVGECEFGEITVEAAQCWQAQAMGPNQTSQRSDMVAAAPMDVQIPNGVNNGEGVAWQVGGVHQVDFYVVYNDAAGLRIQDAGTGFIRMANSAQGTVRTITPVEIETSEDLSDEVSAEFVDNFLDVEVIGSEGFGENTQAYLVRQDSSVTKLTIADSSTTAHTWRVRIADLDSDSLVGARIVFVGENEAALGWISGDALYARFVNPKPTGDKEDPIGLIDISELANTSLDCVTSNYSDGILTISACHSAGFDAKTRVVLVPADPQASPLELETEPTIYPDGSWHAWIPEAIDAGLEKAKIVFTDEAGGVIGWTPALKEESTPLFSVDEIAHSQEVKPVSVEVQSQDGITGYVVTLNAQAGLTDLTNVALVDKDGQTTLLDLDVDSLDQDAWRAWIVGIDKTALTGSKLVFFDPELHTITGWMRAELLTQSRQDAGHERAADIAHIDPLTFTRPALEGIAIHYHEGNLKVIAAPSLAFDSATEVILVPAGEQSGEGKIRASGSMDEKGYWTAELPGLTRDDISGARLIFQSSDSQIVGWAWANETTPSPEEIIPMPGPILDPTPAPTELPLPVVDPIKIDVPAPAEEPAVDEIHGGRENKEPSESDRESSNDSQAGQAPSAPLRGDGDTTVETQNSRRGPLGSITLRPSAGDIQTRNGSGGVQVNSQRPETQPKSVVSGTGELKDSQRADTGVSIHGANLMVRIPSQVAPAGSWVSLTVFPGGQSVWAQVGADESASLDISTFANGHYTVIVGDRENTAVLGWADFEISNALFASSRSSDTADASSIMAAHAQSLTQSMGGDATALNGYILGAAGCLVFLGALVIFQVLSGPSLTRR